MPTRLNLSLLRERRGPIAPAGRENDFDPMQKRIVTLRHGTPRQGARYVL
jgi:hypothetical protein